MPDPHNDFEVAKSIHDHLEPLNEERRARILRWVSESLGLGVRTTPSTFEQPAETSLSNPPAAQPSASESSFTDIKSFAESKAPKTDGHFATVVAYYYRFVAPDAQKSSTIDADTLQNATRLVGRQRFKNANTTLNNAKKSGYLDSPQSGEFEINTVGENLVAMTLPSDSTNTPTRSKRKSSPNKSGTKSKPAKKKK